MRRWPSSRSIAGPSRPSVRPCLQRSLTASVSSRAIWVLEDLQTDPLDRTRHDDFASAMVYGESVKFAVATGSIAEIVNRFVGKR